MRNKFKFIDVIKGIGIISIIYGHLGVESVSNIVSMYHVAVFFIVSGFTLNVKKYDFSSFCQKKFFRLMIPYFVTSIFLIIISCFNQIFIIKNPTIENISNQIYTGIINLIFSSGANIQFGNLYIGTCIGAIWFLPALFFSLIVAYKLIKNYDEKRSLLIAFMLSFISYVSTSYFFLPFSIQPALFSLPFVLIGYIFRKNDYFDKIFKTNNKFYLLIISILISFYSYITSNNVISFVQSTAPDFFITIMSSLASSFIIIYIAIKCENNKFLEYLGRNSLIVLCVHLVALNTLNSYILIFLNKFNLLKYTFLLTGLFHILLSFLVLFLIKFVKYIHIILNKFNFSIYDNKRILEIDISKGIIILLMIFGHFNIPYSLRNMIYSFHMPAFIIFSGYFYNSKSIFKDIKKLSCYYLLFSFIYIILKRNFIVPLIGISFSNKFFTNIPSVGPIYFVTLLIIVKIIYYLLSKYLKNELYKSLLIISISLFGIFLSSIGFWLPFSFDISLYSIVFYHIGYLLKKYKIINYLKLYPYMYFIFAFVWVTFIYLDRFELATRVYGNYSFAIISATSATLLLILFSSLLKKSYLITYILNWIGKNTIWLLLIETLLSSYISLFCKQIFNPNGIYYCILVVMIDLLFVLLIKFVINFINHFLKKIFNV